MRHNFKIIIPVITTVLLIVILSIAFSCDKLTGYSIINTISKVSSAFKNVTYTEQIQEEDDLYKTQNRSDYATKNDLDFANFRSINVPGIKSNYLYRGSTPLENSSRSNIVNEQLNSLNINNIINLENSEIEAKQLPGYESSNYKNKNVLYSPVAINNNEINIASFNEIINFIINSNGPIYIHCCDGNVKTGLICAILEGTINAGYQQIIPDYMESYDNLYINFSNNIVAQNNLDIRFSKLLGLNVLNLHNINLCRATSEYLLKNNISKETLGKFKQKISHD